MIHGKAWQIPAVIIVIIAGVVARWIGMPDAATRIWMTGLVVGALPIVVTTLRRARRGEFATDLVATMAIVGAVVLGDPLPGLIIVLMQSGGEALERHAGARASAAVRALEDAAPRVAHRVRGDVVDDLPVDAVVIGDELLIRPGEPVPCDAVVLEGSSDLDTSRLTGEPLPVPATPGLRVMSGTINGMGTLRLRATALAVDSQYARIVELVRTAQGSKAPLQRLADRYAVWFTPLTIAVCAVTYFLTGDAHRVLAVLVVATPCPLILATPVAIVGGIDRAARQHLIIRHGGALERLARITLVAFDKTGTLTIGRPRVARVRVAAGMTVAEVLSVAAAAERGASHLLARVVVEAAEGTPGYRALRATATTEAPGRGVTGWVDGRRVTVGARAYVLESGAREEGPLSGGAPAGGTLTAYVAMEGRVIGAIEFADAVRPEVPAVLTALRALGVHRVMLISGDDAPTTRGVAAAAGIDDAHGDLLPQDKAAMVTRLRAAGEAVLMVGDGINDAPALSSADVGAALASHGGGITAESADVVVLADSLAGVAAAVRIGRRTMRIARQSIWVGLGASGLAMVFAAMGRIPPTVGAALQEAIDVAVILNALRTSWHPRAAVSVLRSPTSARESRDSAPAAAPAS